MGSSFHTHPTTDRNGESCHRSSFETMTFTPLEYGNSRTAQNIKVSENDKADLLEIKLGRYKVALEVLADFPAALEEFKRRCNTHT